MKKKTFFTILLLAILIVSINAYLINNEAYHSVTDRWVGYFVPIIWAIFIAMLMDPAVIFFKNKFNMNKVLSITLVMILFILSIMGIFLIIVPQIVDSVEELMQKSNYIIDRITTISNRVFAYLNERNLIALNADEAIQQTTEFVKNNLGGIKNITVTVFMNMFFWVIGFVNLFIGLILAVVMIYDRDQTIQTRNDLVLLICGKKNQPYVIRKLNEMKQIFLDYLVGKGITCIIMGIISTVILILTGTPYAIIIGLMIGLGNMIPYVGNIIFGFISLALILIMAPNKFLYVIGVMCLVQFLDGFILGPKIIGNKVGLNSFWVMVSIMIFGGMFGIVGMFLAVPIMTIVKSFYYDLLEYRKNQ